MTKPPNKLTAKPKPAYQRIKENILKNIHAGKWQAGEAIPTEHALAEQFSVSRMTVNRALKELSEERVLQRRQGSGTFVAQQQFNHTFVEVRNIAEDIKSDNKHYQAKVLSKRRMVAGDISAHILGYLTKPMLNEASQANDSSTAKQPKQKSASKTKTNTTTKTSEATTIIDEVKIVHIADGQPIQFEERWVDASLVPQFIEQDFSVVNTSDYLIEQAPLQGGSYTITAVAAPAEVASALNINEGDPALLLSRQTYSAGQVVTFVNMWHAGNRYQFSGTL